MSRSCVKGVLSLWLLISSFFAMVQETHAQTEDRRIALLVGHQFGWKQDPPLRYVRSGDLEPMAKVLKDIGFEVILLFNQDARRLRLALKKLKRKLKRNSSYKTLLFYYSGHADKHFLHLGKKGLHPFGYKEFSSFFRSLPVTRRIAIFDSCYSGEIIRQFGSMSKYKRLLQEDRPKGIRARKSVDLKKLLVRKKGFEEGTRIISSSLDIAWELSRYKASVFTHHLIAGMKGKADLNKDGTISLDELFDFASRKVKQETGQRPQQLLLLKRHEPYALAPSYQSRLFIGPHVQGTLDISVANFYWSWKKKRRRSVRIAIIPGRGIVQLRHKKRCWVQTLHIPKRREVRLGKQWRAINCLAKGQLRKGGVELSPSFEDRSDRPLWDVEVIGGLSTANQTQMAIQPGGLLSLRRQFFALTFAAWTHTQSYAVAEHSQLQIDLLFEGGYRRHWGAFDLFIGGYIGIAGLFQDLQQELHAGTLFRYGVKLIPAIKLHEYWSLTLHLEFGFSLGQFGGLLKNYIVSSASMGLRRSF